MKAKTPEEKKAIALKAKATREANKAAKENVLKNEMQAPSTVEDIQKQGVEDLGRVVKVDMEPAQQNDNPAPNNGNAQKIHNKPIGEYNATDERPIVRREATPEEEAAAVGEEEEPRHLVIGEGPGNLSVIKWNRGGGEVPGNCKGGWNNKQRAMEAIRAAHAVKGYTDLQEAG